VFIIAFFAACAQFRQPSLSPSDLQRAWQEHQFALQKIEEWNLKGRLAVDAIKEAWTGTLRWTQEGDKFEILWLAPFGQGSVELRGNHEIVILQLPKEEPMAAASAEEILETRLGWSLPVSGLRYWLLGLPAPELPVANLSLDPSGRLLRLSQGGWKIRYLGYKQVNHYELPGKVFLNNPKLRLRLVIDHWHLV
jgi:outer membrane lipoprotein LolB